MSSTVDADRVQEYLEPDAATFEKKLEQLADLVRESRYTVFYTGAGVSTSSGIGDYRGPNGAWTLRRIRELEKLGSRATEGQKAELQKLLAERQKEQPKSTKQVSMLDAQPSLTHMMQATLIREGLAHYVVTTNLDGIYRKAGLKAHDEVCFLHGDVYTERCTGCGYDFERNWHVRQDIETIKRQEIHVHDHSVGTCSRCGSAPPKEYTGQPVPGAPTGADSKGFKQNRLVGTRDKNVGTKDTHINFGECLDEIDWKDAETHCSKADLCIVMGTSMSLRHITHFPFMAKKTVIVNLQQTPDDKKCHLRIWAQCDPVSAGLLARLNLEPLLIPVWRPRDALAKLPASLPWTYRDAAQRLEEMACQREKDLAEQLQAQRVSAVSTQAKREEDVIAIGNKHSCTEDDKHAWELYVSGSGASKVQKVEVWLHPTFSKNHHILDAPPFKLGCVGWGVFDIKLRLHKAEGGVQDVTWKLQFDKSDDFMLLNV
jgi:NAD-dependent SIR2 family protein deacetylase